VVEFPVYQRILLATDGSETAMLAARHAVALASKLGAELVVSYVVDTHHAFMSGIHRDEALRELRQDGQRALTAVEQLAQSAGVRVRKELCQGRPGEEIVRLAAQAEADLVVLGTNGQGAMSDLLLGSVSQYVVHRAQVPVFVVRPPGPST
jgi:nucleotide-binding universal stress UspA family protein